MFYKTNINLAGLTVFLLATISLTKVDLTFIIQTTITQAAIIFQVASREQALLLVNADGQYQWGTFVLLSVWVQFGCLSHL